MKRRPVTRRGVMILAAGLAISLGGFCAAFACGRGGTAAAAGDDAGYKDRILKAAAPLVGPPDPGMNQAMVVARLAELLDLAVELTPEGQYKPEIKHRIGVAKELITTTSIFNEKARQYLSLAHRLMTGGRKFEPPKELDEFVTIAEFQAKTQKYMKGLVDKSVQELEAGRPGETARILVEVVLMVMTPIKG